MIEGTRKQLDNTAKHTHCVELVTAQGVLFA